MAVRVYDKTGVERDWDWLVEQFGPLQIIEKGAGSGWVLTELHEIDDLHIEDVQAWLEDDERVVFHGGLSPAAILEYWRQAQEKRRTIDGKIQAPSALVVTLRNVNGDPAPDVPVAFYWPDAPERPDCGGFGRAVVGPTNAEGKVGFGMGGGAYYWPPSIGPHATWMCGENSDICNGLGMIGGTNHRHLDPTYQWMNPEPPADECPWGEIEQYLGLIDRALAGIRGLRGVKAEE